MHVGQILLVEAESHEEATDKVRGVIEYAENPTPDWSDWNEVGGRWAGLFGKDKNVLRYTENTALAEAKLAEWIEGRTNEMKGYYEAVKTLDLAEIVSSYNPEAEVAFVGETSMNMWRLRKLAELLNDEWTPDSAVYDLENYTANLKAFRERVAIAPEMQFLVIVDFHF